jgi:hypothetical protein
MAGHMMQATYVGGAGLQQCGGDAGPGALRQGRLQLAPGYTLHKCHQIGVKYVHS